MTSIQIKIVQPDYPAWAGTPAYRDPSVVKDLIFHHGDDDWNTSPLAIDAQHRSQGWDGIGYHFVITKDGTIYRGRPINMIPAAAEGDNYASIDVCWCGDFQPGTEGYDGTPSPEQIASAKTLSVYLHQTVPTIQRIGGHRDVSYWVGCPGDATACPGDSAYALLPAIRSYTAAQLAAK